MIMKRLFYILALLLPTAAMAQHWTPKTTYDLPNETPVYVQVLTNGFEAGANNPIEVAAFVDNDCRAYSEELTYPSATAAIDGRFELRVVGDLETEANKDITFRAYYRNIEYEFTTKVKFTGETYTPSPLVLNLDAVTGVSIPETIEVAQPATAFPYTEDLSSKITLLYESMTDSPYTPKGESRILTTLTYRWTSRNTSLLSFNGNRMTVAQATAAQVGGALNVMDGQVSLFNANTTFVIEIATIPVESITCSLTQLDVYALEDILPYFDGKVTVLPATATDKSYYLTSATNYFSNNSFSRGGQYTVKVVPSDQQFTGTTPQVAVTVWMRPRDITTTAPQNTIYVGLGENVFDAIQKYQQITYPVNNPGEFVKDQVSYKYAEEYIDSKGIATQIGQTEVTVSLDEGITEMATVVGHDSYTVTVVIESQLYVRMDYAATNFYKDGTVSTEPVAYVYVTNPGNEPFDPTTDLTVECDHRYDGYPYAVIGSVRETTSDGTEEGETCYGIYLLPLFAGTEISCNVLFQGEPLDDNTLINISRRQNLAAGWNWISMPTIVSPNGTRVEDVFTTADLIEIRSQLALLYNDPNYGLVGGIAMLTPIEATYKVKTNKATVAQMGSYNTFHNDLVNATLKPGYNWLNYPYEFSIPAGRINQMLDNPDAPFTPTEGDMIIKRDAFAIYQDGEWVAANNFALNEGEGMVYKYNGTQEKEIIFEAAVLPDFEIPSPRGGGHVKAFKAEQNNAAENAFVYDKYAYADNMALVATIQGLENPADYTLGVFVGNECRGRGQVVRGNVMFVNAVGQLGEQLTFRLMNNATGEMTTLSETMTYSLQKGSLQNPVVLNAGSVTGIDMVQGAGSKSQDDIIYDLSGRRVGKASKGIYIVNGKKVWK